MHRGRGKGELEEAAVVVEVVGWVWGVAGAAGVWIGRVRGCIS